MLAAEAKGAQRCPARRTWLFVKVCRVVSMSRGADMAKSVLLWPMLSWQRHGARPVQARAYLPMPDPVWHGFRCACQCLACWPSRIEAG